jgi:hypothetical protein
MRWLWNSKHRHQRVSRRGQGKLGQIQGSGLAKVGDCFFDGFALGSSSRLWIECDEAAFFGVRENGSKFHCVAPGKTDAIVDRTGPTMPESG